MIPIPVSSLRTATSCVEAGVDFSFRTAFRESWGLVNLLQIAGRASRLGEYGGAEVWDFRHDADDGLSLHPQAKLSRRILEQVFAECAGKNRQPGPDDCTDALQREILQDHGEKALRVGEIFLAESARLVLNHCDPNRKSKITDRNSR